MKAIDGYVDRCKLRYTQTSIHVTLYRKVTCAFSLSMIGVSYVSLNIFHYNVYLCKCDM